MNVAGIQKKTVAIVVLGPLGRNEDGKWPVGMGFTLGQFFQVTVDPEKFSPDGQFIYFGRHKGDEILGWQLASVVQVVSVLGEWDGDEPPTLHYAPGVSLQG